MPATEIVGELDPRFSSDGATPPPWDDVRARLADAELYWLSTVRADGRPHITPLIAVWLDDSMHFCTGPAEQKARNLGANRQCVLMTGCNTLREGFDVVVEGAALQVTDETRLQRLADAYVAKYGEEWRFEVRDGAFWHEGGGSAPVYEVAASKVLGFGKGDPYSHSRYRF